MAFGQPSGPPASAKQVKELLELLNAAGHSDFRDARGPLGFTQRQAGGKFTRDEADEFIARLQEEAEFAEATGTTPEAVAPVPASEPRPKTKKTPPKSLAAVSSEDLAAELQSRGWVVMEP
ncbi:MAG: hypothetical protein RLZ48_315 [Actinomycetota bacterium]|jgi:hypothetical protein|nr:hypothetical protein [Actinomycetota bacterium]